jgi:hypothetical protein
MTPFVSPYGKSITGEDREKKRRGGGADWTTAGHANEKLEQKDQTLVLTDTCPHATQIKHTQAFIKEDSAISH